MKQKLKKWIRKRTLTVYFFLTYAFTWAFAIPLAFLWDVDQPISLWFLFFLPLPFGPSVVAILMIRYLEGKSALKSLLAKLVQWRVSWRWLAFIALVPLGLPVAALLYSGLGQTLYQGFDPSGWLMIFPIMLIALPFGPLPEELGWRGFALPRLRRKYGVLWSGIFLGVVWTFWHTPMFWIGTAFPPEFGLSITTVLLYLANTTAISVLITVVHENTRGSVMMATLFHLTFNVSDGFILSKFPELTISQRLEIYMVSMILTWLLAITSVLLFCKNRGRVVEDNGGD